MANPILMPKPGQMTEECTIVSWKKKEGEKIAKGDVLFEIETDKSNMEVEAFDEGTLLKILVKEGQSAPVNSVCGFVGQPGEALPEVKPAAPAAAAAPAPARAAPPAPGAGSLPAAPSAPPAPSAPAHPEKRFISPRAKRLAEDAVIGWTRLAGSGPGGRIVERDVRRHMTERNYAALRVTPAAKALAAVEKLDLLELRGSGEGGRITVEDVRRAAEEKPKALSKMRQVIAQRLTHSFTTTPHFYVTVAVDMTDLLAFRAGLKARGEPFSVTDFILQAVVLTLLEFPTVNSTTDGKQTWWHGQVNLGVAVALDAGLVVPVIRGAENLSLRELHDQAEKLVEKARAGKLLPDEMSGGTFTVSNMGMLDVENFAAIINPGEGAILAVASTRAKPVVRDGQIAIRSLMALTLSTDHRLVDGALAARFSNAIRAKLEDLELWRRLTV